MVYETFLETIHTMVQNRLGNRARVSLQRVLKNNGLLLDGLTISSPASTLSPTVYLNAYYDEAEKGLPLTSITEQILLLYEEAPIVPSELGEELRHFESVSGRIAYKLINAGDNAILLSSVPHYRYFDLAVVFYLIVSESQEGQMTALIHHEHLKLWDITPEQLIQLAEANTPRLLPCRITPIEEAISQMSEWEPEVPVPFPPVNLHVLTNDKGINGASCLLYPDVLKTFSASVDDDLIILPSSIHEVLLTPKSKALPIDELNEMVRTINAADVSAEDRLSDHVYCYSREQNCLYLPTPATLTGSGQDGTGNPQ